VAPHVISNGYTEQHAGDASDPLPTARQVWQSRCGEVTTAAQPFRFDDLTVTLLTTSWPVMNMTRLIRHDEEIPSGGTVGGPPPAHGPP
jgi:hypothetical protein